MPLVKQPRNFRPSRKGLTYFYRMLLRWQMNRFVLANMTPPGTYARLFLTHCRQLVSIKQLTAPIFLAFFFSLSLNLCFPMAVLATETVIPVIYLNEEQKGEYLIQMTEDRDFLIKAEDLKGFGLLDPKGKSYDIEGVSYLSLKSMVGVTFLYDENKQTLKIQASPELLTKTTLDFTERRRKNIQYPKDNSVFLNYGITYNASDAFKFESVSGTSQLGIKIGNFLFLSDSTFSRSDTETKFNRLMSSITYDRRDHMDTFVLGDFFAQSSNLGSCLLLGGLSYSKNYSSNPFFIKRPVQDYQGFVNTPSEIDVYLNGMRIRSERVSPGTFDIRNIQGYGGSQDLEIVIKDAFGREQHISNPFYVFDPILAKGLHDYSYNIGFQRKNIGLDKDQYDDWAFMGFHRYGLTNHLTVGLRGEATEDLYNLSPQVSLGTIFGALELGMASSQGKGEKSGLAGSANYIYQGKRFNVRLSAKSYSENYATVSNANNIATNNTNNSPISGNQKLEFGGGIGFGSKSFGSLSLNYNNTMSYKNEERQILGLMYSRGFGKNLSLTFSVNQTVESGFEENRNDLEFFVGLTYYPWKETIMTNTGMSGENFRGNFLLQRNAPAGEGYGYRAAVDMNGEKNGFRTGFRPYFQYNGKYGIYSAEFSFENEASDNSISQTYQFTASGAIVYVGRTFGFSRPVNDSFGLVKVGELPGVRVYHNNQEIGKTNRSGELVIPDFSSYDENQVKINDKDIPLNYALTGISQTVSPSLRSGSLLRFKAKKVQAFTGRLKVIKDGKSLPLEYYRITMKVDGKSITFQTGRDGEFFIEDTVPGPYKASFKYAGNVYSFDINIPKSDEIIIDAGEINVQIQP